MWFLLGPRECTEAQVHQTMSQFSARMKSRIESAPTYKSQRNGVFLHSWFGILLSMLIFLDFPFSMCIHVFALFSFQLEPLWVVQRRELEQRKDQWSDCQQRYNINSSSVVACPLVFAFVMPLCPSCSCRGLVLRAQIIYCKLRFRRL